MPPDGLVYRFGAFVLNVGCRTLLKDGRPVSLRPQAFDVLVVLLSHAGHVVTKQALTDAVWAGAFIGDNSIDSAVSAIRQALGVTPDGARHVENRRGKGYVFTVPVEIGRDATTAGATPDVSTWLDPYRAFVEGRVMAEMLDGETLTQAGQAFAAAIGRDPAFAAGHVGLASVRLLEYEATRADAEPNRAALAAAERHVRDGCRLDPTAADGWSTLAVVLDRLGHGAEAAAAARKAVTLEPDVWRHTFRLAVVSWGADRLRAAHRTLLLCPGLALGHWFGATVFVATQRLDLARDYLRAGCAAREAQAQVGSRFPAVGLHLLHGLVLAAQGAPDAADEQLRRELALLDGTRHVYARECRANTCYAMGALALCGGRRDDAAAAFGDALALVASHRLAAVGLAVARGQSPSRAAAATSRGPALTAAAAVDDAIVRAVVLVLEGRPADAAPLVGDALATAPPGSAGWMLPIEPLLQTRADPDAWAPVLATLAARAV